MDAPENWLEERFIREGYVLHEGVWYSPEDWAAREAEAPRHIAGPLAAVMARLERGDGTPTEGREMSDDGWKARYSAACGTTGMKIEIDQNESDGAGNSNHWRITLSWPWEATEHSPTRSMDFYGNWELMAVASALASFAGTDWYNLIEATNTPFPAREDFGNAPEDRGRVRAFIDGAPSPRAGWAPGVQPLGDEP